jgi:hypothetical protein
VWSWLARTALRLAGWLAAAAAADAVWPLTLVTAAGYGAAWLCGWPPSRLWRAAAWCLPMTGVWLLATALRYSNWHDVVLAPGSDWRYGWHLTATGRPMPAFEVMAPVAVPAGLALAAVVWAWRRYAIETGLAGITASAPVVFDARQWRRQARTAAARTAAPGTVPLLTGRDRIPVGGTIRAVGHRWRPVLTVPAAAITRHMVIVGATGTGKTNLMMRLWAGWFTAASRNAATGAPAPLLVVLDCKGGPDARVKAARARRLLYGAGARRVAIWPDQAALSLWEIPAAELGVLLYQMVETGAGAAAYYADILQAVITLAVQAPPGPPASTAAFLARLDRDWLEAAYGDGSRPEQAARVHSARTHLPDIRLRMAALLDRLGPALDGPGTLTDADAWYCILEGTREKSVAEAQAMALTELVAHTATSPGAQARSIVLAADDYSAVSRRVPLSNLYERGRSLGIAVQVSAQSWHGLGADDDERYRIAATADGGIWVLNTAYPEPLAKLAGTRRVLETAHHLVGSTWGDEGTTRAQHAWIADPDIIRRLTTGQACYIHHGAATYVQVARPRPSPLTLTPVPARPGPEPPALPHPRPAPGSQAPPDLADVLGPETAP